MKRIIRGALAVLSVSAIAATGVTAANPASATVGPYVAQKPVLVNPIIVNVPDSGGSFNGFNGRDVLVRADPSGDGIVNGEVNIYGGHNVVMEGGSYRGSLSGGRALYVHESTGSVWLEGLVIGRAASAGNLAHEGINLAFGPGSGASQVAVVNVKCQPLAGSESTNHSDCIQDWASDAQQKVFYEHIDSVGVKYQGFMWQPKSFGENPLRWELHDIRLDHESGLGGYDIYNGGTSTPLVAENVNLVDSAGNGYYPESSRPVGINLVSSATSVLLPGANSTTVGAQYQSPNPVVIQ